VAVRLPTAHRPISGNCGIGHFDHNVTYYRRRNK
jgi:hypothetical protein